MQICKIKCSSPYWQQGSDVLKICEYYNFLVLHLVIERIFANNFKSKKDLLNALKCSKYTFIFFFKIEYRFGHEIRLIGKPCPQASYSHILYMWFFERKV